jgi:hypothetical protein
MLTRRRLFWGRDNGEVIDKVLAMEVRAPSELAAGVPAELDALVLRNLSRHPADRQETAREFALALEDMAVATASQLGSWVQEIASEALSRRAEIVAELERDASGHSDNTRLREARTPSDDGEGEAQSGTDVVPTIASLPDVRADEGITAAAESPRGERRGLWLGGALLGLLAAIVLVWIGRSPGVPPELATSASPPAPSASAPVPSAPSSSATEAASEPTAAVPDAGASASVPPATAAPSFAWPPVVSSRPSPPLPSAKQVTDPCDPPFTVDDRGIRRLKPQCM